MPTFSADTLHQLTIDVFTRMGAPDDIAACVADHLVGANLAGHDSHGMLRIPQYAEFIEAGTLKPDGRMRVVERMPAAAVVEGDHGFGQYLAREAMLLAIDIAREAGTGTVALRHTFHTGRIGTYSELAARAGMVGLVVSNCAGGGQLVAPFGGTARRLSTNPISIAAPSAAGDPVVLDMATSVAPEGKVRALHQAGKPTPADWLLNARGEATTDPGDFYADPPGSILPLGGVFGHKGMGLAFMIDILAGALTGAGCCREGVTAYPGDGMLLMAFDVARFGAAEEFARRVADLSAYVRDCPRAPGVERIYAPGEIEQERRVQREREGIFIEPGSWQLISGVCERVGVAVPG
ncbi:MAG: Ldh family oxidoreductase [Planctomycetota bacterium]|nr:MAG: Ldh family oxidoreductase [Planctomycetota bacterium]